MKRWAVAILVVAFCCLVVWANRGSAPGMLSDSDTAAIVGAVQERQSPLSWFGTDWPLENHFYRPVSTLTFELDEALNGSTASGMGATNALLAMFSLCALAWLVRELTDSPVHSALSALVWSAWILDLGRVLAPVGYVGVAISLGAAVLDRRDRLRSIVAALLWFLVSKEFAGLSELRFRMIEWIPGRTASTMAVFGIAALACYARSERLGAARSPLAAATPMDRPATKSSLVRQLQVRGIWPALSLVCLALAFGSYEQAVVLPFLMAGVAWTLSARGLRVHWTVPIASFGLLVAYVLLRSAVLPARASAYQEQQFRFTLSALYAMLDFLIPAYNSLRLGWISMTAGASMWLFAQPWLVLVECASNFIGYMKGVHGGRVLAFGFLSSWAAFAPMAFLKPFAHYYYLPMALRSIFVVALAGLALDSIVSAATRPARQAPERLDPATGSLPRP